MALANPRTALAELNAAMETDSDHSITVLSSIADSYAPSALFHLQYMLTPDSKEQECVRRDVACFLDENGALSKILSEDFAKLSELKQVSDRADEFIAFLYSHRALSPCLPQITEDRKDQSEAIYSAWIEILRPFVDEVHKMHAFTKSAIETVREEMTRYLQCNESSISFSVERLWQLAVVIDRIYVIDSLKSVKASINNDFSAFKRASQSRASAGVSAADRLAQAQVHMELGQYLANKGSILKSLKEQVFLVKHGKSSFVHVIAELLRYTIPALAATVAGGSADKAERHLLPRERHSLLRVVPICMVLLGPDENEVRDILQDKGLGKELQLSKLLKEAVDILKLNPVGPLYGDMPVVVHSVLQEAPWFSKVAESHFSGLLNPSDMTDEEAARLNPRYDLREHIVRFRRQYALSQSRFHSVISALQALQAGSGEAWPRDMLQEGYAAALDVLKTMASMIALAIEQAAWKCCRPAKTSRGLGNLADQAPDEELISRYDKMVKFNYDSSELDAILEVMSMSTKLADSIGSSRTIILPLVKRYIHGETQSLLQERLTGMIAHAAKKKRKEMLDLLTILRKVCLRHVA